VGESSSAPGTTVDGAGKRYSEHLYVPWYNWPLPLIGAALMAATIHLGYPGLRAWLPYVVLIALMIAVLVQLSRSKVEVADGELRVGKAHLPLRYVGEVEVIGKDRKRKALGPELDPAAFMLYRGWVGPVLRVRLTDPEDPTPYWVFSTRKPDHLAELLRSSRTPS
jgi:Protein of unknown function (DUF3093)